jgi:hypothetical protein
MWISPDSILPDFFHFSLISFYGLLTLPVKLETTMFPLKTIFGDDLSTRLQVVVSDASGQEVENGEAVETPPTSGR